MAETENTDYVLEEKVYVSTDILDTESQESVEDINNVNGVTIDLEHQDNQVCDNSESNETYGNVVKFVDELNAKMDKMQMLFEQKIMHTQHEEKMVDQMHSELQKYKDDMYSQLVRPILLDIAEVRDSVLRLADTYKKNSEGKQDIPNQVFSDYSFDILDILEKNNVEVYRSNEGDVFVPIKQRVVKKINTPIKELHGKIAESMSDGYSYKGRTISAEKVSVYSYKENEASTEEVEEEK